MRWGGGRARQIKQETLFVLLKMLLQVEQLPLDLLTLNPVVRAGKTELFIPQIGSC